jgi:NADP-dependent aldehyde dehydrogenase
MIIAGTLVTGTGEEIRGFDPAKGAAVEPGYRYGDASHVAAACAAAAEAFPAYRATTSERRAQFLESIADNLDAIKAALVVRAVTESGLPKGRIAGEVGRTTGQLRLFAAVVREGSWTGARIDPAQPDRTPLPRPDIRQRAVALGAARRYATSSLVDCQASANGK